MDGSHQSSKSSVDELTQTFLRVECEPSRFGLFIRPGFTLLDASLSRHRTVHMHFHVDPLQVSLRGSPTSLVICQHPSFSPPLFPLPLTPALWHFHPQSSPHSPPAPRTSPSVPRSPPRRTQSARFPLHKYPEPPPLSTQQP